jgi:hypothetical protein
MVCWMVCLVGFVTRRERFGALARGFWSAHLPPGRLQVVKSAINRTSRDTGTSRTSARYRTRRESASGAVSRAQLCWRHMFYSTLFVRPRLFDVVSLTEFGQLHACTGMPYSRKRQRAAHRAFVPHKPCITTIFLCGFIFVRLAAQDV